MKRAILSLLLLALLDCARETVSRAEWERMSAEDRTLYVKSLLGAEKVKDAKGGRGGRYEQSAEEYVKRIDAAYQRGEQREAGQIFAEMGATR
jgi:hypothetical protein